MTVSILSTSTSSTMIRTADSDGFPGTGRLRTFSPSHSPGEYMLCKCDITNKVEMIIGSQAKFEITLNKDIPF